jgi:hypothetical protein
MTAKNKAMTLWLADVSVERAAGAGENVVVPSSGQADEGLSEGDGKRRSFHCAAK